VTLDATEPDWPLLAVSDEPVPASADRFGRRWRLVAAGLSNVWRYGDLLMDANSGRLLMRGPNGTGKTTALEILWPYLLDLNPRQLGAGQARQTTLTSLMREGANGRRRIGYAWLTFVGPGTDGELSYGVRLQFSEGSSPPVKVVPFRLPVRPVTGMPLVGDGRSALSMEEFTAAVVAAGGHLFADEEEYVADLAARTLRTSAAEARLLASRIRQVRNPNLLGDLGPQKARDALRDVLPGVDEEVIRAAAEALAESEETRKAFDCDRANASIIADFATVWAGHAADVLSAAHQATDDARGELRRRQQEVKRLDGLAARTAEGLKDAEGDLSGLAELRAQLEGRVDGLESSDAYRSAEALSALEGQLVAELDGAEAAWAALASAARETRRASVDLVASLGDLSADIGAEQAKVREVDPAVIGLDRLVTWTCSPRSVLTVGDRSVDPGPAVTVTGDIQPIADAVTAWRDAAAAHTGRADAAALAVTDHEAVAVADRNAAAVDRRVDWLNERLDHDESRLRSLEEQAGIELTALLGKVASWTNENRQLAMPGVEPGGSATVGAGWDTEDIDALRQAEAGQVLVAVEELAATASNRATNWAGQRRADAKTAEDHARELRTDARELRRKAEELRAGKLLPLPRPAWAGDGNDDDALGAAIEWQPVVDGAARLPLEAALSAAGLLGATLTDDGASTGTWRVDTQAPIVHPNLTDVLAVDTEHPRAGMSAAVLERVALADTAASTIDAALVIGRDGTFRAGVTVGAPALVSGAGDWPPAQHVGARQRRAAALGRAAQLEAEATDLETEAGRLEASGEALRREASELVQAATSFPTRGPLRGAEASRADRAAEVAERQAELEAAVTEAARLHRLHRQLHEEWAERTRGCGLPTDLDALGGIEQLSRAAAGTLRSAAGVLADRLAPRLGRLLSSVDGDGATQLAELFGKARAAMQLATATQSKMDVLRESAGADIDEVLRLHQQTKRELGEAVERLGPATTRRDDLRIDMARLDGQLSEARRRQDEAEPLLGLRMRELVSLLEAPGVADALFAGGPPRAEHLLPDVAAGLATAKAYTSRTVRDRYDEARARLAGSWVLANGDPFGELLTYQFNFQDDSFTPTRAATHATALAERAEAALAVAEEKALRDFVVGMLPSAIRTGWVRMFDWTREVNAKMRSASASSQLSVQVRISVADDMSEHARTVYELACKVFDGDRSAEQDLAIGHALQALIGAAEGADMAEKVAAAVNIRDWVDVNYEIHRADGTTANWTARTGLSGGERRLVVLAPMLAAIAAGYDRFGETALRLAALDEVPAEVDEQGREGLARYLAQLDLDLVCTSYLWDGAPGAWDGVDAWDLEAGPDTTVVAFPILVRGVVQLPGDDIPARPDGEM